MTGAQLYILINEEGDVDYVTSWKPDALLRMRDHDQPLQLFVGNFDLDIEGECAELFPTKEEIQYADS